MVTLASLQYGNLYKLCLKGQCQAPLAGSPSPYLVRSNVNDSCKKSKILGGILLYPLRGQLLSL